MKTQRNTIFDIAKFLAICLVVLGHLLNECAAEPAVFINFFHMPVLFFISGYFAASSIQRRTAGEVLKKKAVSLLIPYMVWSGVSLLANGAISVLSGGFSVNMLLDEAVQIFLYTRSVWFLIELFVSFGVFLGIYRLLQVTDKMRYEVPVHIFVWLLLTCFVPGEFFAFYKFKWLYPFFMAGYLVSKYGKSLAQWVAAGHRCGILQWGSLLFPLLVWVFFREEEFVAYTRAQYQSFGGVCFGVLYYLISALGVLFTMTVARWISKSPLERICAEIGTYSMDIYVIHMFLIKILLLFLGSRPMGLLPAYALFGVIALVFVVSIWGVCKLVLRKIPLYRWVVGLK